MAKKSAVAVAVDSDVILRLDPNTVLADDNTRFNLKESRILTLADSIISQGGVIEPVEVEPLPEPKDGFTYRLTLGYYRHAAIKHLNTTMAAGLTLPAILHVNASPTDRLKRQLAENIERENQSPMDQAIAIKRLMDAGIPRIEIRQLFATPGGKKGGKVQPASNSYINIRCSFLDLPKSIQEKIHQGVIGTSTAYQLTKVDKDKQVSILEQAESQRQRQLEQEERDEEKLLNEEKKAAETQEKAELAKAALQAAELKSKETAEALEKQTALTTELFKASKGKHTNAKDKKAAESAFVAAEKQQSALDKAATESQKEYEKAQVAYTKLTSPPAKKEIPKAPKKAQISGSDVQKAAAGDSSGAVPLNATEMRKVVAEMSLPTGNGKSDDKLIAIGKALGECFAGITTPETLYKTIKKIAG